MSELGALFDFSSGKSIKPGGDGSYPAFGSNGLIGRSEKSLFDAGVIIGRVGAYCGSIAISTSPFWASDNTIVALPKERLDLRFGYYLLTNAKLNRHAGGAAQPLLTQATIRPLRFPIPSLNHQRRIASILGAYDDLIEVNRRRIALLEEMARRLFEEWFVHFRYPGSGGKLRPSILGEIPQGWGTTTVDAICPLIIRGVTPKYQLGSGRFIINQKVNRGSELLVGELKELDPELAVPPNKFARFGDVLVNCLGEGTIGRVHFFKERHREWAVDQHMSICRSATVDQSLYVFFSLEAEEGQKRIASLKTGATSMTMLNISALRSFALVAPPTEMLARFSELALPSMRQTQALTEINRNLSRTRDLLLPRLISGELSVASAERELEAVA